LTASLSVTFDREALRLKVPDPAAAAARSLDPWDCDLRAGFKLALGQQRKNCKQSEDRGELTSLHCFGHGHVLFP